MAAIISEVERFNRLSVTWWNKHGPMRPLHVVNALRLDYVISKVAIHFERAIANALYGLRVLDVGCGGGLLAEPMARHGAIVLGVDASSGNIAAAKRHALLHGVEIDYRLGEPDTVLLQEEKFDVVVAFEVIEHVSNFPAFLSAAASKVAPGGMLFVSTIDRTWKSYVFAILGAEYILKVLPRGTHQWAMFVRPDEVHTTLTSAGLVREDLRGMRYDPFKHRATWCLDTRVNYIATYGL